jgi:hypothetical protein
MHSPVHHMPSTNEVPFDLDLLPENYEPPAPPEISEELEGPIQEPQPESVRYVNGRYYCNCGCGKDYGRLYEWQRAHSTKRFPCPFCLKVFKRPYMLKNHIREKH